MLSIPPATTVSLCPSEMLAAASMIATHVHTATTVPHHTQLLAGDVEQQPQLVPFIPDAQTAINVLVLASEIIQSDPQTKDHARSNLC